MAWLGRKQSVDEKREEVPFRRVGQVEDVPPGTAKVVFAMGREIGLFNIDGELKAIENVCPHNNRPIGTIEFDDTHVTCLWHGLRFRFGDGVCPEAPHYKVRTFPVRIEGGDIYVGPPEEDAS